MRPAKQLVTINLNKKDSMILMIYDNVLDKYIIERPIGVQDTVQINTTSLRGGDAYPVRILRQQKVIFRKKLYKP